MLITDLWKEAFDASNEVTGETELEIDEQGRCLLKETTISVFSHADLMRFGAEKSGDAPPLLSNTEYEILLWACKHLTACYKSSKEFRTQVVNKGKEVKLLEVVTPSDMAFSVMALGNYWELHKSIAAHEFKLQCGPGMEKQRLGEDVKRAIDEKQKVNRVHPFTGGNKLSGADAIRRYKAVLGYIKKALGVDQDKKTQLEVNFASYCESKRLEKTSGDAANPGDHPAQGSGVVEEVVDDEYTADVIVDLFGPGGYTSYSV